MLYDNETKEKAFKKIIHLIANEKMSLRAALKEPETPSSETFYKWLSDDEIKAKQYAHACEERADSIFEEILNIADDGTNDYMTNKNGDEILNSEHVQRSKLRLEARKWVLAKMNPKKYGDKLDLTTGGENMNKRPEFVFVNKSRKKK